MSKNKKTDMLKFHKFYSKMGILLRIRETPNDEVASYVMWHKDDLGGTIEIMFDEEANFIKQNYFGE